MKILNQILGILFIGALSFLFLAAVFYCFQILDYTFYNIYDVILFIFSSLVVIVLAPIGVLKLLKSISNNYEYHFIYWLVLTLSLSMPLILNGGFYWFYTVYFIGIPLIGINYLANGFKSSNIDRHQVVSYYIFFIVFAILGYGKFKASNSAEYSNEEYEFEVNTYTIPTFLDWQIEGEIEIDDKRTGESYEFDFSFGNGPYFKICKDATNDSLLYLMGTQNNGGYNRVINLKTSKIEDDLFGIDEINIIPIVFHGSSFELTEKESKLNP